MGVGVLQCFPCHSRRRSKQLEAKVRAEEKAAVRENSVKSPVESKPLRKQTVSPSPSVASGPAAEDPPAPLATSGYAARKARMSFRHEMDVHDSAVFSTM